MKLFYSDQHASRRPRIVPLLFAVMCMSILTGLFFGPVRHSFAQAASDTCGTASSPLDKVMSCDGSDPVVAGCATNAETFQYQSILQGDTPIGMAQMRYSRACNTYWGRVFSYLPGKVIFISIDLSSICGIPSWLQKSLQVQSTIIYTGPQLQAYSNMIYDGSLVPTMDFQIETQDMQVLGKTSLSQRYYTEC